MKLRHFGVVGLNASLYWHRGVCVLIGANHRDRRENAGFSCVYDHHRLRGVGDGDGADLRYVCPCRLGRVDDDACVCDDHRRGSAVFRRGLLSQPLATFRIHPGRP